jgi:ribosomal protein S18 acetylase RimI-like enzyme
MTSLQLQPYTDQELPQYLSGIIKRFTQALVNTGVDKSQASNIAEEKVIGQCFPGRKNHAHQLVFHLCHRQANIGWLWLSIQGKHEIRIADIFIEESERRKGFAKEAMIAVEKLAQEKDMTTISLNVFEDNVHAKLLYINLGYKVMHAADGKCEMQKTM